MLDFFLPSAPLFAVTYETTSLPWLWRQTQQQWGEQIEAWLAGFQVPQAQRSAPTGQDFTAVFVVLFALGLLALIWLWVGRLRAPASVRLSVAMPSVPITNSSAWWEQARQLQQRGDYRGACLSYYQALLRLVSECGVAAEHSSRTDGEYQQLLAAHPHAEAARELIGIHEQLAFGDGIATAETCERCRRAYEQWH